MHLYEIINYDRRESLIALFSGGIGALLARLKSPRPKPIAHWGPEEVFAVERLASALPAAKAEERLKSLLACVRWHGWKTFVWRA